MITAHPTMRGAFRLEVEFWTPRPLEEVFEYFADAGNLQELTPPWLNFHIETPLPIEMRVGALIDYRLRLRVIPIRWRTLISAWEPPFRFVDEQIRGPYRLWHHEHTFRAVDGGTMIRDRVDYSVPGGWLAHQLFVKRDLERIFRYREETMQRILGGTPRTVGISAATGVAT